MTQCVERDIIVERVGTASAIVSRCSSNVRAAPTIWCIIGSSSVCGGQRQNQSSSQYHRNDQFSSNLSPDCRRVRTLSAKLIDLHRIFGIIKSTKGYRTSPIWCWSAIEVDHQRGDHGVFGKPFVRVQLIGGHWSSDIEFCL